MTGEYPNPVPQLVIAETPDGREFLINGEATVRATVASGGECKVVRIPIDDQSQLAALEAEYKAAE
jgi:hypothetical protein